MTEVAYETWVRSRPNSWIESRRKFASGIYLSRDKCGSASFFRSIGQEVSHKVSMYRSRTINIATATHDIYVRFRSMRFVPSATVRPHRMHRCGLLWQMSHVAWPV